MPELLETLTKQASNLLSYQKNFPSSRQEIDIEVAKIEISLESLRKKLRSSERSSVKRVYKEIKSYETQSKSSENMFHLYLELQKLIAEINELQSDLKWEK